MWPYYGGKRRLAGLYPPPVFGTIIEPFAGAAAYSCLYPERDVVLIDRDPDICALWRYLIDADPARLLDLPVLGTGDEPWEVSGLSDPERMLLAFYNGRNRRQARPGAGGVRQIGSNGWRGARSRVAEAVEGIRHWTIIEGSYEQAPDVRATWFVDPPYQGGADGVGGSNYRYGNEGIDFAGLGAWVRARRGQTIVCDYEGADWLPFRPLASQVSAQNKRQTEVVYLQGPQVDRLAAR